MAFFSIDNFFESNDSEFFLSFALILTKWKTEYFNKMKD